MKSNQGIQLQKNSQKIISEKWNNEPEEVKMVIISVNIFSFLVQSTRQ